MPEATHIASGKIREIYALDDETLKPLWSFNAGSYSAAPPMITGS